METPADRPAEHATLRSRLVAAGVTEERLVEHVAVGRLKIDGEPVHDLDQPYPAGTRAVIAP